MKNLLLLLVVLCVVPLNAQTIIKHVVRPNNTQGHITTISSASTDGKSNAILIVTQNYGVYNNNEIGVWFSNGKWKIFNQNLRAMPVNAEFNILVLPPNSNKAFVHTTATTNISSHITTLNSALTNAKPNALIYVTQRFGQYNTSNVGVYYTGGRWKVFNEKTSRRMPVGTQFNILVLNSGENSINGADVFAFRYTNTSIGHISVMKPPIALARSATLFTTQSWRNIYNPNITGVWYNGRSWTTFNQNRRTLPKGIRFNVLAANYKSAQIREERTLAITSQPTVKPMIALPKNVTVQNFSNKLDFNSSQKTWLRNNAVLKTQAYNFYEKNQTENGRQFTKLAVETLMNDGHVNFEEAFIETSTNDSSYEDEGTEDYIPFPIVLSTLDTVEIKFGITSSDNKHANQKVSLILIEGIQHAVELANSILLEVDKIKSIYIMATTNGQHGTNSNHYSGAAADISRINDEKMAFSGLTYQIIQLQSAFDLYSYVRENFGPAMKHKYTIENDSWNYDYNVGGHTTHIHISVRK